MNILFWVLQVLLALHTAVGAVWKFSHSAEQTMPSLSAIPHGAWLALSIFELLCSVGLLLPVLNKRFAMLVPISAIGIALEMLLFSGLHLYSGDTNYGPMVYWLVVAALCVFLAYGRFALRPII
ncbi:DoxX family protein [Bdellovibrio bacteriovorus]|uniref:DoxX family protein n=1 Tax=Bdellovibrio bacteriovorus TaxID=959 RepID=UPI0035A97132